MNLQELIDAEKADLEAWPMAAVDVILHGEGFPVAIGRLLPDDWASLVAKHAPRPGTTDETVGYNQDALTKAYPVSHITVDGEPVEQAQWVAMFAVLGAVHRANIINTIWGQNVYPAVKARLALGKATAGKRPASRAPKASPSDGGSGGNPAK